MRIPVVHTRRSVVCVFSPSCSCWCCVSGVLLCSLFFSRDPPQALILDSSRFLYAIDFASRSAPTQCNLYYKYLFVRFCCWRMWRFLLLRMWRFAVYLGICVKLFRARPSDVCTLLMCTCLFTFMAFCCMLGVLSCQVVLHALWMYFARCWCCVSVCVSVSLLLLLPHVFLYVFSPTQPIMINIAVDVAYGLCCSVRCRCCTRRSFLLCCSYIFHH